MNDEIQFLNKQEVCKLLGVSERTLEKLVCECKFPPGLAWGKQKKWVTAVVQRWLRDAVATQVSWEPPKRQKAKKREALSAREIDPSPSA